MPKDTISILQFTDTHLFSDPSRSLCGINTTDSLKDVLKTARERHWPPDFILVTGDIAQDASVEAYQRFKDIFEALKVPIYCLPGNHDNPAILSQMFTDGIVQMKSRLLWDNWQILMLNSTILGKNDGHLSDQELHYLDRCLEKSDKHALVCMHHNPMNMGSQWLDTMVIDNGQELFRVTDRYSHVRGIVWGHVHQEYSGTRNGVPLLAAPSTSIQFKPTSKEFRLDSLAPGYRWINLTADGKIQTGIERLNEFKGQVDLSSTGY